MAANKLICVLFGILVISAWVLGSAIQAGAETMNFKLYTHAIKTERTLISDVEGHSFSFAIRRGIYAFENGEYATHFAVNVADTIKGSGSYTQYSTITFQDGSTVILKQQAVLSGTGPGVSTSSAMTGEIIKGTGRFEGIKGTQTTRFKFMPVEKREDGPKGIGDGTLIFTLPSK